jgi:hypothetical protein
MSARLRTVKTAVAYSIPEAAAAVGVGETAVKEAIDAGLLTRHYVTTSKPVILADDLLEWVRNAPTERAS